MNEKVEELVSEYSKKWLFNKLEISFVTFEGRVKNDSWKNPELKMIDELHNHYITNAI